MVHQISKPSDASKIKIGVCLDKEVVEWLDKVINVLRNRNRQVSRSKIVNYLLSKIRNRFSANEVAERILKEKV